ncbi:MAG: DoxX family membrane protein [Rothia sp. (in: high G+C Gram-positive bacteria)]|nr:DoxX family membrane protein [Rothia sp. (in: high G+C Gram-positive bacteria)]
MSLLSNAALRLTSGALILNSGIGKLSMDEGTYAYLQQMAKTGIPQVEQVSPKTFGKALAYSETALGAALLLPIVPAKLAGLGLTAFSAGMLTMYFGDEKMTMEDGIRPSQEGTALAKDVVLLGAGLALFLSRKGK